MGRTSKGYFTGNKTHKTWAISVLAYYYGSFSAFAESIEEKSTIAHSALTHKPCGIHIKEVSSSDLWKSQIRIFSKIVHLGFGDLLEEDGLLPKDFSPIPEADIYWLDYPTRERRRACEYHIYIDNGVFTIKLLKGETK